jgi:hypothetical protein
MGLLHEYFAAPSDRAAASVVDDSPKGSAYEAVDLPDIDPTTMLAAIEHELTGRDEDDIADGPRYGDVVAESDGAWVVTVTDELQRAIADASDDRLAHVAESLTADEEYADFQPELLAGLLGDLAGLSRRATASGMRVYCWQSL